MIAWDDREHSAGWVAMTETAAVRVPTGVEVTFEIYVRQRGRWTIHQVMHQRDEAVRAGQALASERSFEAVRVVRDQLDPRTGESHEALILDTELHVPCVSEQQKQPRAEPPRSVAPEPEIRRRAAARATRGWSWLALSVLAGNVALALAGLALWLLGSSG